MSKSSIEWTDATWNPVSGCTRVSDGCNNCYAVTMTKRLEAMGQEKYAGLVNIGKGHFNGVVKYHEDALMIPLKARKPRRWFVNSMSDLFHKEVPFEFIDKVFAVMALCPQHTFQILTKRPERMAEYLNSTGRTARIAKAILAIDPLVVGERHWQDLYAWQCHFAQWRDASGLPGTAQLRGAWPIRNVWLGTSVEDQATADERIPHLLRCPAAVRFLSCEPLLGPVDLCKTDAMGDRCACTGMLDYKPILDGYGCSDCQNHGVTSPPHIHWCIVGGESGPGARPFDPQDAHSIMKQCEAASVPFFFKQMGSKPYDKFNDGPVKILDPKGHDWVGYDALRKREFPA